MSDTDQALRDVVRGAGVTYVGLFIQLLIAFFAQVIAARHLSLEGFGGLTTGTAILNVGGAVAVLGLGKGLARYLSRVEESRRRSLVRRAVAITLAVAILVGATISLTAGTIANSIFSDPTVTPSIAIFGAVIPFAAVLKLAVGGHRGQKVPRYKVYVKNFTHPITRITLVVAAVLLGFEQAGIAGAYAIPYVLSAVVALYLLHRSLPASGATFDETITRDLLSYSLPMTVTDMAGFIYRNADIFLILWLLDSGAVAIYGVAYAAVKFMEMFSSAFSFLSTPVASELDDEGERADFFGVFTPVVRWLTIASTCMLVPLGVFAEEFLTVIYGVEYGPGGAALVVLAIGFAIRNVLAIHGPILEGLGRSRLLMNNSLSTAVLNLGLNLVLIPRYGILGAAIATAASCFIRELLSAIEVWYIIGEVPVDWSAIGPAAVGSMLIGAFAVWVGPLVPGTFLWLVVASGAFSVVYLLVVLTLFGLSTSEVMVIRSVEERFGLPLGPLNRVIRFFADE